MIEIHYSTLTNLQSYTYNYYKVSTLPQAQGFRLALPDPFPCDGAGSGHKTNTHSPPSQHTPKPTNIPHTYCPIPTYVIILTPLPTHSPHTCSPEPANTFSSSSTPKSSSSSLLRLRTFTSISVTVWVQGGREEWWRVWRDQWVREGENVERRRRGTGVRRWETGVRRRQETGVRRRWETGVRRRWETGVRRRWEMGVRRRWETGVRGGEEEIRTWREEQNGSQYCTDWGAIKSVKREGNQGRGKRTEMKNEIVR